MQTDHPDQEAYPLINKAALGLPLDELIIATPGCEQPHSEVCESHLDCPASDTKIEYMLR
jgi:hypothetical protein